VKEGHRLKYLGICYKQNILKAQKFKGIEDYKGKN
jgi:hypothetical protein